MSAKNILITICGPSTTGKSTLSDMFKNDGYKGVVTTTTRPPRTGEIDGVHYHFVTQERFNEMIKDNELVEHNSVGKYSYGLSKKAINDVMITGYPAVLVMEPQGANQVALFCEEQNIQNHKVYVNNTLQVLIERLIERKKTDAKATDEVYKERLFSLAFLEPENWTKPAYSGEHKYDQIFDTFVADNQKNVYDDICNAIKKKLEQKNSNKRKP